MEKKVPKKLKIKVNSIGNIEDLLQETYRLADELLLQAQNEIIKLSNSSKLQDEAMDSKAKYAKAIRDLLDMKEKAISKKVDIAKMLTEIYKFNGDSKKAIEENSNLANGTFDFQKIRDLVNKKQDKEITTIELKK